MDLITVYKASNNIGSTNHDIGIPLPLYIQQLFYNLVSGFKRDHGMKLVIKSDFDLLDEALSRELIVFPDQNSDDHQVTLSPFMQSLCSNEQIVVFEEFLWVIHGVQLNHLQSGESTKIVSDTYYYNVPGLGKTSFVFIVKRKTSGSNSAAFAIQIKETNAPLDGRCSVMIDEVKWSLNDITFFGKSNGGYKGRFAFQDKLIDETDLLTVKIALYLSRSS